MLLDRGGDERGAQALADAYCRQARRRISGRFWALFWNDDKAIYSIARRFLEGEFAWLERGVISLDAYRTELEIETEEETPTPEPTGEPVTAS